MEKSVLGMGKSGFFLHNQEEEDNEEEKKNCVSFI